LHVVDSREGRHLSGYTDQARTRVQVDCWAETAAQAVACAARVHATLRGLRGDVHGVTVLWTWAEDARDQHVPPRRGSDRTTYRITRDYQISHRTS
jgi:hypothetical protein